MYGGKNNTELALIVVLTRMKYRQVSQAYSGSLVNEVHPRLRSYSEQGAYSPLPVLQRIETRYIVFNNFLS
jgi:hypothetical protein